MTENEIIKFLDENPRLSRQMEKTSLWKMKTEHRVKDYSIYCTMVLHKDILYIAITKMCGFNWVMVKRKTVHYDKIKKINTMKKILDEFESTMKKYVIKLKIKDMGKDFK